MKCRPCSFSIETAVRGYYVYKTMWSTRVGDILYCETELSDPNNQFVIAMHVQDGSRHTVGHLISTRIFQALMAFLATRWSHCMQSDIRMSNISSSSGWIWGALSCQPYYMTILMVINQFHRELYKASSCLGIVNYYSGRIAWCTIIRACTTNWAFTVCLYLSIVPCLWIYFYIKVHVISTTYCI